MPIWCSILPNPTDPSICPIDFENGGESECLCNEFSNTGFSLPANVSGCQVKAFLREGTDLENTTMKPLFNVVSISS